MVFVNLFAIAIAFYMLTAEHISQRAIIRCAYVLSVFGILTVFVLFVSPLGWNLLVVSVVGALFINKSISNFNIRNFYKCWDLALTVLVYFTIIINSFAGVMLFINREDPIIHTVVFDLIMIFSLLFATLLMKKHKEVLFQRYDNAKLLLLHIGVKVLLISLANIIVPLIFVNMEDVSVMSFTLVTLIAVIAFVFSIYMSYVLKLEREKKDIAVENAKLTTEAANVNMKYDEIVKIKHFFGGLHKSLLPLIAESGDKNLISFYDEHITPINIQLEREMGDYDQIDHIKLPLIRSAMAALVNTVANMPNVELHVGVDNEMENVPIDEKDLFKTLNIFIENALEEVASHDKAVIAIYITATLEGFILIIENSVIGNKSTEKPGNTHKGLQIVEDIIISYPNVDIVLDTRIEMNRFSQRLEMGYY